MSDNKNKFIAFVNKVRGGIESTDNDSGDDKELWIIPRTPVSDAVLRHIG